MWDKEVATLSVYTGKEEKTQAFGKSHKFYPDRDMVKIKLNVFIS
jgi:hypothetical protein